MEVITIEKKTYEAMMERFRILTAKVDALCREVSNRFVTSPINHLPGHFIE